MYDGKLITESIHILRYIQEIFFNVALYLKDTDQQQCINDWMVLVTNNYNLLFKTLYVQEGNRRLAFKRRPNALVIIVGKRKTSDIL